MNVRVLCLVLLALVALCPAQRRRDPLTDTETDQLREVAMEPEKRLKLYVDFARARLAAIDQLRSDPKFAAERGRRIHDLLEDFTTLEDELDDNVQDYAARKADLRKPLAVVIQADSEFQLNLRTLEESAPEAEARQYKFVLTNALESVDQNLDSCRELLARQQAEFRDAKEAAKKKK